jgi:hypothetical protein
MRIHSGYKTITPIQFANALWALHHGLIDQRGIRVYLACFALVAVREAAARYRRRRCENAKETSRYTVNELERITGLDARPVRRALRQLESHGLVVFSESTILIVQAALPGSEELQNALACRRSARRPIPVPRSILRFLARTRSGALLKTVLIYLARGLSIARRSGEVCEKGTVKASWIAEAVGLSQRAVKYAQAELRALGWISKDTQSTQRKLNRDGAYFVINLKWRFETDKQSQNQRSDGTQMGIVNRDKPDSEVAPPRLGKAPAFAPPIQDKKTSIEMKHRETQASESRVTGVCGEGSSPSLQKLRRDDLFRFSRLEALYFQAIERGWISASEATALNFLAAAVRAREVGRDPVRLFVSLIRRQLWHHITQTQEDCARRALARYREENPERFRLVTSEIAKGGPRGKGRAVL